MSTARCPARPDVGQTQVVAANRRRRYAAGCYDKTRQVLDKAFATVDALNTERALLKTLSFKVNRRPSYTRR